MDRQQNSEILINSTTLIIIKRFFHKLIDLNIFYYANKNNLIKHGIYEL